MNVEKDMIREENTPEDSRQILREVYEALSEKGYNPIGQIVGYLLSEDPTYITNCHNARALIRKIDRDELMGELVKNYLELD
ncbi:MAG: IreB family regulatory phosphoprotein [Clostridia bacterium]|nr:IreB family regulatory phosphoprotein [Clostridia bacterium]